MKKQSNNKPVRIRRPGEAPESYVEMMKIIDRVCKSESKKKVLAS